MSSSQHNNTGNILVMILQYISNIGIQYFVLVLQHTLTYVDITYLTKGQKKLKLFFQVEVSSKKRTNEFYFITMKPQVDLFLMFFGGN